MHVAHLSALSKKQLLFANSQFDNISSSSRHTMSVNNNAMDSLQVTLTTPVCFSKKYNANDSQVLVTNFEQTIKHSITPTNKDAKNKFAKKNCLQCVNYLVRQIICNKWSETHEWKQVDGSKEEGYRFVNTQIVNPIPQSQKIGYFELSAYYFFSLF